MQVIRERCPACALPLIMDAGYATAPFLLVGSYPGVDEIKTGMAFTGATGKILKQELIRAGLGWKDTRLTNLWLHEKAYVCLQWMQDQLLEKMQQVKAVLLMGVEPLQVFIRDAKVMDYSGLQIHSDLVSCKLIMVSPNPAIILHGTIGEFRLALNKFAKKARELG